ncbi:MAG: glutathione binding-like protein [Proteobacteria bacterium]|nr:glutathione binding-like protein [Pseudomonadota bacterium]
MNLYFAPLACSLATRISLYEAAAEAQYTYVDAQVHRLPDGADYFAIAPMGQVPLLETDDGMLLSENSAVLQYVAESYPQAQLAPAAGPQRARLQQWLCFIGTELHKAIFAPLLDPKAPPEVKAYARTKVDLRLATLQAHLAGREFLLERFTVADAYLTTILNWAADSDVDLKAWPAVFEYYQRQLKRPSIARAVGEEFALYKEEQARRTAAA